MNAIRALVELGTDDSTPKEEGCTHVCINAQGGQY